MIIIFIILNGILTTFLYFYEYFNLFSNYIILNKITLCMMFVCGSCNNV